LSARLCAAGSGDIAGGIELRNEGEKQSVYRKLVVWRGAAHRSKKSVYGVECLLLLVRKNVFNVNAAIYDLRNIPLNNIILLRQKHFKVNNNAFVNTFVRLTSVQTAAADKQNVVLFKDVFRIVQVNGKVSRQNADDFKLTVPMCGHNVAGMRAVNIIILNGKSGSAVLSFFHIADMIHKNTPKVKIVIVIGENRNSIIA